MSRFDGVVLLGHGSRRTEGADPLRLIAAEVQERLGAPVAVGFLQLATPTFAEAVEELVSRGARRIAVMPFFLFPGAHVLEDIPAEIERLQAAHPQTRIALTAPLGVHSKLCDIVLERIEEVDP